MAEAELAGDFLMALVGGVQTNKSIEQYYRKFEDDAGDLEDATDKFDKTMSYIGEVFGPEELAHTNWSRIHLFYTLFTSIAHCLFEISGPSPEARVILKDKDVGKV